MNWSTRLRRWVRISTPPVWEASTKPSAATVLPAPVACSNQKRLAALGSSGCSARISSSSSSFQSRRLLLGVGANVLGLLLFLFFLLLVLFVLVLVELRLGPIVLVVLVLLLFFLFLLLVLDGRRAAAAQRHHRVGDGDQLGSLLGDRTAAVGLRFQRALRLGQQRRERARERVDLVGGEDGPIRELGLIVGEQPLQAEHQRVAATPFGRWVLGALLDLCERVLERPAAGRPGRKRDGRILSVVHEALAHELLRASYLRGGWNGRGREGH